MSVFRPEIQPLRYGGNPIIPLVVGSPYESQIYDFSIVADPTDATKLLMYASGMAAPVATGVQTIVLFTASMNFPNAWTYFGQVLLPTLPWEGGQIRMGTALNIGGTVYMYYSRGDGNADAVGLATSTNGRTFTKYAGNPILTPGGNGRNDGDNASQPAVLKEGGAWTMIYSYRNAAGGVILPGFRAATSSDGIAWTKVGDGDVLTTVPLYAEFHQLLNIDGTYVLIYESGNGAIPYRCFIATSSSPLGPFSPLISGAVLPESGAAGAFDCFHTATPCLAKINGVYKLFYCGAQDHAQPYGTNHWPGGVADFIPRDTIGVNTALTH